MEHLISSIDSVFTQLNLKRTADWEAIGGRAGVGMPEEALTISTTTVPCWNDEQLGLLDGTAPQMLEGGSKSFVLPKAVKAAEQRLTHLLDAKPVLENAVSA